jgi:hypothetical protein
VAERARDRADPGTPAPLRFLPTWDATLPVHARRAAILPEEHRPKGVPQQDPQSVPTFLVDGSVAGTWRYDTGKVKPSFGRLDAGARGSSRRRPGGSPSSTPGAVVGPVDGEGPGGGVSVAGVWRMCADCVTRARADS